MQGARKRARRHSGAMPHKRATEQRSRWARIGRRLLDVLVAKQRVEVLIQETAANEMGLSKKPLPHEPESFRDTRAALVADGAADDDAMKADGGEGKPEHQARRARHIAAALGVRRDPIAELRRAIEPLH